MHRQYSSLPHALGIPGGIPGGLGSRATSPEGSIGFEDLEAHIRATVGAAVETRMARRESSVPPERASVSNTRTSRSTDRRVEAETKEVVRRFTVEDSVASLAAPCIPKVPLRTTNDDEQTKDIVRVKHHSVTGRAGFNPTASPWAVNPGSPKRDQNYKHQYGGSLIYGKTGRAGADRVERRAEGEAGEAAVTVMVTVERSNGEKVEGMMDENVLHVAARLNDLHGGDTEAMHRMLDSQYSELAAAERQRLSGVPASLTAPGFGTIPEEEAAEVRSGTFGGGAHRVGHSLHERISRLQQSERGLVKLVEAVEGAEISMHRHDHENDLLDRLAHLSGTSLDDAHQILDREEKRQHVSHITGIDTHSSHDEMLDSMMQNHHHMKPHSSKTPPMPLPEYTRSYGYRGPGRGFGSVYEKNANWSPDGIRNVAEYRGDAAAKDDAPYERISTDAASPDATAQEGDRPAYLSESRWQLLKAERRCSTYARRPQEEPRLRFSVAQRSPIAETFNQYWNPNSWMGR